MYYSNGALPWSASSQTLEVGGSVAAAGAEAGAITQVDAGGADAEAEGGMGVKNAIHIFFCAIYT